MNGGRNEPLVKREDRGRVALLVLNRPEAQNALSNELLAALEAELHRIELDRGIRAVVLTGEGQAFSRGADLALFGSQVEAGPTEAVMHALRPGQRLARRIESFPKPVIAAVNGLAHGAGCELVEAAHLAIAAEGATFANGAVDLGLVPAFGGTQRLPRHVGRKAALELLLTGRMFDATEACHLGLVNRVVPRAMLMHATLALADTLAGKAPLAVAALLGAVHRGMDASIDDGLAIEEAAFARLALTADAREGLNAGLRKESAAFAGR